MFVAGAHLSRQADGRQGAWRRAKPYVMAAAIVAVATLIAEALYDLAHLKRLAGVFLLSILIVASRSGARVALFASLLAFIANAYFIVEPRFTLDIDTYQEGVNLLAFIVVAVVTGQLAGRLRGEIDKARARALRLSVLFDASRALSATAQEDDIRQRLAGELAKAAQGRAEVIWNGQTWEAGVETEVLKGARWITRELHWSGAHLGVCRWRSDRLDVDQGATQDDVRDVIVELGASALARARLSGALPPLTLEPVPVSNLVHGR